MIKLFSILAIPATALTATAAVGGQPSRSFTHDGFTYVYEATSAADGSIIIAGQTVQTGTTFRLVVRNGHVTGEAHHRPVSFSVADSRGAANGAVTTDTPLLLTSAD